MSNFSDWTIAKLDERFNLTQVDTLPVLTSWLESKADISPSEQELLTDLRHTLTDNVLHWNEQELSLHFIGPFLRTINFTQRKFNIFAERYLAGTVDGETLSGYPDGLIASGWREPKVPYFYLQKRNTYPPFIPPESGGTKEGDSDPVGQCLAAMLVAQELNKNQHPIYGCYILGRDWFFMVLQGRQYAISEVYAATKEDIFDIFRILKGLKAIILAWIAEEGV